MRWALLITIFWVSHELCWAVPSEGLESFGLFNRGLPSTSIHSSFNYTRPVWIDSYGTVQTFATVPTTNGHFWTAGALASVTGSNRRDAYFLRYDHTVGDMASIGLKYIHEDWWFIDTGKESVSLDANMMFATSLRSGFYLSVGFFYRWMKQRWDKTQNIPLTFTTNDYEAYVAGLLGWQAPLTGSAFYTMDINNRDAFSFYNGDNLALDVTINWEIGRQWYLQLMGGSRLSALLSGTAYPATTSVALSLIWLDDGGVSEEEKKSQ